MSSTLDPRPPQQPLLDEPDLYLKSLMGWLHRLLAWQIDLTRRQYGELADDAYRGLYIPDAEIEILSAADPAFPADLADLRDELADERGAIEASLQRTPDIYSPLLRLARLFDLSSFAQDVLLLALAPELDLRYERIYGYIQDDVTKKRPSVDLALRLLCHRPEDRVEARAMFAPEAPLMRHLLLQLYEDGQRQAPLLAKFIKVDDRIVAELIGRPSIDSVVAPFVTLTHPNRSSDELVLPVEFYTQLRRTIAEHPDGLVLSLQGSYGSGRRAIVEALCSDVGLPLLFVDLDRLLESGLDPAETAQRVLREALLHGAAVFWQGADRLLQEEHARAWRLAILATLDHHQGFSCMSIEQAWESRGALRHKTFLRIEMPLLSYTEREQIWRMRLNGDGPDDATLQALASTFRLSGGQIRDAASMARSLARWGGATVGRQELYRACRAQSSGKLDSLAHKINTTYTWDDIVLPTDQILMLKEICVQVRHRRTVLERWGFDRQLAMGKGVNVLFAGQSGTGKTMAAEIIGSDLGLELYKVDLSTMVSKYIGETEKNLDRIFTAAREANAILFFDEADAIFGKRSEVKDAHDRYANIEVGYLLQKMEEYDGIVILSTNLRKNMDDAFVRRLHVAIDFPFPEEPDRLRIWHKVFPAEAPLASDIDLDFMAKQFKLAGGNIRNIALLAAFLAAEDGDIIHMEHVVRATRREYQKLGKLITETDFGPYMKHLKKL